MQLILGNPSKWEDGPGVVIRPWTWLGVPDERLTVRCALHVEGGFRQHLNGYFVRAATVEDIFLHWGFGWTEVILNWDDYNRALFHDPLIQAHVQRPICQRLIMPDDGHQEGLPGGPLEDGWWVV